MSNSNRNDDSFPVEPLTERFEPVGRGPIGELAIRRAVDHKDERFVAFRRLTGSVDVARVRELMALLHDRVLPVTGAFQDSDGTYLVGAWGDSTLDDRLGQGPFSESDVHGIAAGIADALRYLHRQGIAPVGPRPEHLVEMPDGTVRLGGLALPAAASANPAADRTADLVTLGQTLLCLATGLATPKVDDLAKAPASMRAIIRRCLTAGDAGGFKDSDELVSTIASATAADDDVTISRDLSKDQTREPGATSTGDDEATRAEDLTDEPTVGSRSPTTIPPGERLESHLAPIPRAKGAPDEFISDGEHHPDAFPWRPVEDLYKLVGQAKEGGMGSVRMAVEKATGRKVAIKRILIEAGARRSSLERFYREAHAIANLNHPHILSLLQPARDEQGDYLVLEWAARGSLKDALEKDGKLTVEQVLDVARKIGSALAYAHDKGVIHRDIKPHNILLTETGEPKLADFGLARSIADLTLSSSRGGAGSPLYMAPEQHTSSREADARSDLYSFGKTLYQLATGKPPVNPDAKLLPIEIRTAVMRCLEDDPAMRPATAKEFLAALNQRPTSPKPALIAVAVAALALVVAFASGKLPLPGRSAGDDVALNGDDLTKRNDNSDVTVDPNREPGLDPDHPRDPTPPTVAPKPKPMFMGLFDPTNAEAKVAGETVLGQLLLKLKLDGDVEVDPSQVKVMRNGEEIDATTKLEDGTVTIDVDLAEDDNSFEVEIPGYAKSTGPITSIRRVFPEPQIDRVLDMPWTSKTEEYVTKETQLDLAGVVEHGEGLRELWLGFDGAKTRVLVQKDGAFDAQIPLPTEDGVYQLNWYWPDKESRLKSGITVAVDRTPPEITLREPTEGFYLNREESKLPVSGSLKDDHLPSHGQIEVQLEWNGEMIEADLGHNSGSFAEDLRVPSGDGDLVVHLVAFDAAKNVRRHSVTVHVDRSEPTITGQPSFLPQGSGDAVHSVSIRGNASESLSKAFVNGQTATVNGATFSASGLDLIDGRDAYEVELVDLAGNHSRRRSFGHGLDLSAPNLSVTFRDAGGSTVAVISSNKSLASVTVNGKSANPAGSGGYEATVPYRLSDLRNPNWGPTHDLIRVTVTDSLGMSTSKTLVVQPKGDAIGIDPKAETPLGRYCQTPDRGDHATSAPGSRQGTNRDWWINKNEAQCGLCGWPTR